MMNDRGLLPGSRLPRRAVPNGGPLLLLVSSPVCWWGHERVSLGCGRVAGMEDRIEQRITIRATLDHVWSLVTRPGWWLPGSAPETARGMGRATVEWGAE